MLIRKEICSGSELRRDLNRGVLTQRHGGETIRTMIIDVHKALDERRIGHAAELFMALRHFLEQHPDGRAGLAVE
jgi:hypothetical protein